MRAKLIVTGAAAGALLRASAHSPGGVVDPATITRRLERGFRRAEAKGGCAKAGDAGEVGESLDAWAAAVVALLRSTTTTTSTTTSTTTPPFTLSGHWVLSGTTSGECDGDASPFFSELEIELSDGRIEGHGYPQGIELTGSITPTGFNLSGYFGLAGECATGGWDDDWGVQGSLPAHDGVVEVTQSYNHFPVYGQCPQSCDVSWAGTMTKSGQ